MNVNKHTRAGKNGKTIYCPHCMKKGKVFNFAWTELKCLHCKEYPSKTEWLLAPVKYDLPTSCNEIGF